MNDTRFNGGNGGSRGNILCSWWFVFLNGLKPVFIDLMMTISITPHFNGGIFQIHIYPQIRRIRLQMFF